VTTLTILTELRALHFRRYRNRQESPRHIRRYYDVSAAKIFVLFSWILYPYSATYATQNSLATHARSAVEKVSGETDTSILAASLRRSLALSIPPPTLYYNYHVGECQDLVFGVTLVDYATARGSENEAPKILRICIDEVDKRGLDAEGIYRVSSSTHMECPLTQCCRCLVGMPTCKRSVYALSIQLS
jgi:RhoGAP domain